MSRALGRQVGLLIDRRGRVEMVIVGKADAICIPELPRARSGATRLRGLHFLHTHLSQDGLSQEDLMDMLFLRLDAAVVLTVNPLGDPVSWQAAHLLPPGGSSPFRVDSLLPWDQCETELVAQAQALEAELSRSESDAVSADGSTRALLVSVSPEPRVRQERNLDELAELARTAGVSVRGRMVQRVHQTSPRFLLGRGKMAELEVQALLADADLLIFDGELTPAQLHSLADITERRVIDRTQLILDIFAQHATTSAGKLQVELAQLKYTLPRLTGQNQNRAMDRLMGGIGGRGLGETKLEMDRRRSRDRMARLRKELDLLRRRRESMRETRSKSGIPLASLVGYTNAGKSSLLNRLTRSTVKAENMLFATLDPTTRRLRFPQEREIILADTVGFIRSLPDELREAFQATLEELEAADLLIHVADASHPDLIEQMDAVSKTLEDLGFARVPRLLVLNKWDLLPAEARAQLGDMYPTALHVSARTGEGLGDLLRAIENRILVPSSKDRLQPDEDLDAFFMDIDPLSPIQ